MTLEDLRQRIDRIDEEIVRQLNERAAVALEIGRQKRQQGAPVVDPAREGEVIERVRRLNRGPMNGEAVAAVYRAIVKECARVQEVEQGAAGHAAGQTATRREG